VADPHLKSLQSPDDLLQLDGLEGRTVVLGDQTFTRTVLAPGWRWSTVVRPIVGTASCTFHHQGVVLRGRLRFRLDDGRELEAGPDDVFDIPPGHDAWVIGREPYESIEIGGAQGFGRALAGIGSYVTSIMLTDIVNSTATLERVGEAAWQQMLASHIQRARRAIDEHHGVFVATTGDGLLATFDSAARAVRCAAELHRFAEAMGIRLRVGVHTGEVDPVPGNIRGMAVHIAARVAAAARPGETLVSQTTREMISAPDVVFEDRGDHELKGISGTRRLHASRPTTTGGA
jgi:class 3 adenylate cyclase